MNILVTGAAGFIGFHLAAQLVSTECVDVVVGVTRDRTRALPDGVVGAFGDILDGDFCLRVLSDYNIDVIMHLASQSIVRHCAEDPVGALMVNIIGTARLLEAARHLSADRIEPVSAVVMTSDKVYGHAQSPYDVSTPFDPRHPYEVSKAAQDNVALMYCRSYDLPVNVVRAVNVYGPNDPNDTRLIPNTIARLLRGESPVIHAGAHRMKRQFVYVDDVVDALIKVAMQGKPGHAYCIGGLEAPTTPAEIIRRICEELEVPFDSIEGARAPGFREIDEQSMLSDSMTDLGWLARTTLQAGLRATIAAAKAAKEKA